MNRRLLISGVAASLVGAVLPFKVEAEEKKPDYYIATIESWYGDKWDGWRFDIFLVPEGISNKHFSYCGWNAWNPQGELKRSTSWIGTTEKNLTVERVAHLCSDQIALWKYDQLDHPFLSMRQHQIYEIDGWDVHVGIGIWHNPEQKYAIFYLIDPKRGLRGYATYQQDPFEGIEFVKNLAVDVLRDEYGVKESISHAAMFPKSEVQRPQSSF